MALKKPSSSKKMGKNKKKETAGNGSSRIGKMAENQFTYDTKEFENRDFLSTVELLDTKAILSNVKGQPIALENGYSGYLQIMEVRGKDLNSLSDNERQRTIQNFRKWNSEITFDYLFESTTLPTDTSEQIIESRRILNEVRREMSKTGISENRMEQLKDRESILMQNILSEEAVEQELYNAEFLIWLYGDTIEELHRQVRKAQTSGNGDFVPVIVSANKKEQILKQYNNQNEKV
ncbi:hypothetical protein ACVRXQ_06595 [Streptococcus panodentis]|uniref:Uncharacterized protein n=1 Tax=Streptococcus panodentis TaxID=1581472 RepID=A0ABS5AVF3_9STRE|nr:MULTISPECIES: hypothetical protein [Streptococcus]KXT83144.1 hypothetical protein STRDD11_01652 [Streptococcus sp. DD11]MBP2620475.1 hypothetical protein [Streptococcus panodentis]